MDKESEDNVGAASPPHPCAGAPHPCIREDPFIVATAHCGSGALYPVLVLRTRLKRREAPRGGSGVSPRRLVSLWRAGGGAAVRMKGLADCEEM